MNVKDIQGITNIDPTEEAGKIKLRGLWVSIIINLYINTNKYIEKPWVVCEEWSREKGMQFQPEKSELIHFSRRKVAITLQLRLRAAVI